VTIAGIRLALAALAAAGLIAAGCGGDDDSDDSAEDTATTLAVPGAEEAAALQEEIADLSDDQQVARVGEEWADLFGKEEEAMCGYLHPDIVGGCALYVQGALTGSTEIQRSYAGATVESVDIKGGTAVTKFSNGERVEFQKDPNDEWKVISVRA
jgi:hypothetical protein